MKQNFICQLLLFLLLIPMTAVAVGSSGMYQWSVELTGYVSGETGKAPNAYLWVPDGCESVKAVVFAQQNMTEEMVFRNTAFQKRMKKLSVALLWVAPAFTNTWDPASGCQKVFDEMLTAIAFQSGHEEIAHAPIIPFGHSAQATMPWNFAAWNADRTLCIVSFHGDAPRTNLCGYGTANVEWGRTRNIDGIPGLMIIGEYEWWDARVRPALAFRMMYPGSCVSLLCDTGSGHFDCSPETIDYIARFIEKSLQQRLTDGDSLRAGRPRSQQESRPRFLRRLNSTEGWLVPCWSPDDGQPRAKAAPVLVYGGDTHEAFWYIDEEMAKLTEQRHASTSVTQKSQKGDQIASSRQRQRQYMGFETDGKYIPFDGRQQGGMAVTFVPDRKDSLTMHLRAVYTDSTHVQPADGHAKAKPRFEIICGPARKTGDTTLRLYPYEAGMDNPRRSFTVWVVAIGEGDDTYKRAVQPMRIDIPASVRHLIK